VLTPDQRNCPISRVGGYNATAPEAQTHELGLLQASFRPDAEIRCLRVLARHRAKLIRHRAPHILHMQQALKQMNIQLSEVLSNITGVTGQAIVRAIVAGERDPVRLAQLRNPGCKHIEAEIEKALTGSWQQAQIFILQQNLQLYDYYTAQLAACDSEMERYYQAMESRHEKDAPLPDLPKAKPGSKSKNEPNFNVRAQLARIVGVDLVAVMGLSASSVQAIITEIGTDMTAFPTVKHFCAWLGLAPRNDISGGKVLRSRTMKVHSGRIRRSARRHTRSRARIPRSGRIIGRCVRGLAPSKRLWQRRTRLPARCITC
jgi:transposase